MLQAEQDALVLLAQQGNNEALTMLIRELQPQLLRMAYRFCGDKEVSQDAVQTAWLEAIPKISKVSDPRVFKSWMFRAVKWRIVDLQRKHKKQAEVETYDHHKTTDNPLEKCGDTLTQMIEALPDVERQAVILFYGEELSLAEISLIENVPIGTVKTRLYRARKRLQTQWEDDNGY